MPASTPRTTRSYLPATQRRRQLLDSAARLAGELGLEALSMQGVADAAGVSRQLIYQHFASPDELHSALLVHLFEPVYRATRAAARSAGDVRSVLRRVYELFLDMPEHQRRLVRALAGYDRPGRPEIERATRNLRAKIADIWIPYLLRETELREPEARGLAWMLIVGAWSLSDRVGSRELGRAAAVDLFVTIAAAAIHAGGSKSPAKPDGRPRFRGTLARTGKKEAFP